MNKSFKLAGLLLAGLVAVVLFQTSGLARLTGTDPGTDIWCVGPNGAEVCVDASGNIIPSTTNDASAGTSSLRFSNVFTTLLNVSGAATLSSTLSVGAITGTSTISGTTISATTGFLGPSPSTEVIQSDAVITANACGGVKVVFANGAVTTNTTNTLTAPAAANDGCVMSVVNIGSDNLTLDYNTLFQTGAKTDIVLGANDSVLVVSSGAGGTWYEIGSRGS